MALNATLRRLRNLDGDRMALSQDPKAFIAKWQSDVESVYARFDDALRPYVQDGTAVIETSTTFLTEDLIGDYGISTRIIEVLGRRIHLTPKARIVPGATGRIDLFRESRPSEANRIIILRGAVDADYEADTWMIQDRRGEPSSIENAMDMFKKVRESRNAFRLLDAAAIQDSIDYVLNV